ncbi:hypothetical protein Cgig2_027906 [Carnegiea gigantea]|uniref:Uncharacterized protein n=1 Tax=Carnegiea gigantea TaxID=171969 RepID=A0A9Q1KMS9_9CARY|nr:hypothetical protein Cgig2_027906 [Carnegiea gigantea]
MSFLIFSFSVIVAWLGLLLAMTMATGPTDSTVPPLTMITAPNTTKPGCPRKCGNITVPYPFGVGLGAGCSSNNWYDILCMESSSSSNDNSTTTTTTTTTKAFLPWAARNVFSDTIVEIVDISETHIRVKNQVAYLCFNANTSIFAPVTTSVYLSLFQGSPYSVSATSNRLTVVGCHDKSTFTGSFGSSILGSDTDGSASCRANCSSGLQAVSPGQCNGIGCCQAAIPKGMRSYSVGFDTIDSNHTDVASYNPCGYTFLGDQDRFKFLGVTDLDDPGFMTRVIDQVPVVLDWVIADGDTCAKAKLDPSSYACQGNATCVDAAETGIGGYRCSCLPGYQGNPYLAPGCSDINECEDPNGNPCSMICKNTPGNYTCSCPSGYSGDGRVQGTGCRREFPVLQVALGVGFGTLLLLMGISWTFWAIRKRRIMKMKENFFQQNGGLLLKQLISPSQQDNVRLIEVFNAEELKAATKNFAEDMVVGKGGYGTVYRGILPNNQVVAIKRSKFVDQSQIEQFINELVILARVRHPNVVRLLGCCLEVEVPLLVYEFISNGTLYEHICDKGATSWYSWSNCLRIAAESANALAYLHSIPIIHRDIKSTNILLDESYTAKCMREDNLCDILDSQLVKGAPRAQLTSIAELARKCLSEVLYENVSHKLYYKMDALMVTIND